MATMMNLEAELARYGVKRKDIAKLWGCTEGTVINKIKHRSFSIEEAITLRDKINPSLTIEYLYATNIVD